MSSYNNSALTCIIHTVRAEAPPDRRLIFELELRNSTPNPLVVLRSDVRVAINNVQVADGDLLRVHFALVSPAILAPGQEHAPAEFNVPLSREALSLIEERRAGDVTYAIDAYLRVAPVIEGETSTLGVPRGANLIARFGNSFVRDRIPQSQWLELLRNMGWDETLMVELPYKRSGRPHPVALQRWEEAVEHYRSGDWEDTLAACRRVFEMLALEKSPEDSVHPDMRRLREWFDPSKKGDHLNEMLKKFADFLHLGRHQQAPISGIKIAREDAMLALSMTAAILRYVSK